MNISNENLPVGPHELLQWIKDRLLDTTPTVQASDVIGYSRDAGYRAGWNDAMNNVYRTIAKAFPVSAAFVEQKTVQPIYGVRIERFALKFSDEPEGKPMRGDLVDTIVLRIGDLGTCKVVLRGIAQGVALKADVVELLS